MFIAAARSDEQGISAAPAQLATASSKQPSPVTLAELKPFLEFALDGQWEAGPYVKGLVDVGPNARGAMNTLYLIFPWAGDADGIARAKKVTENWNRPTEVVWTSDHWVVIGDGMSALKDEEVTAATKRLTGLLKGLVPKAVAADATTQAAGKSRPSDAADEREISVELGFRKKPPVFAVNESIVVEARFVNRTDKPQVYRGGLGDKNIKHSCQIKLMAEGGKVWSARAVAATTFVNYKDIEVPAHGQTLIGEWDLSKLVYSEGSRWSAGGKIPFADIARPGQYRVRWWDGVFQVGTPVRSEPVDFEIASLAGQAWEMLRHLQANAKAGQPLAEKYSAALTKTLHGLLEGEDPRGRHEALIILRDRWGNPGWVPAVIAALERMLQQPAVGWDQAASRIVACEILGKYPDERAIPVLLKALNDPFERHSLVGGPHGPVGHYYRTIWWEADAALRKITNASPIDAPATHVGPKPGQRKKTLVAWKAWFAARPAAKTLCEPTVSRPPRPGPSAVAAAAARAGVRFQFTIEKKVFRVGEPVLVTARAINPTDKEVVLQPESMYPSLFDFGIWDNGQPLMYSVNMARNTTNKAVTIPAKSSIVWAKEDVVACTMAFGGGPSSLRQQGKHRLSFGTGEVLEFVIGDAPRPATDAEIDQWIK